MINFGVNSKLVWHVQLLRTILFAPYTSELSKPNAVVFTDSPVDNSSECKEVED